jgi:hypothetical protein
MINPRNILSTRSLKFLEPLYKVFHDTSLFGDGTRSNPLRIIYSTTTPIQSLYHRYGTGSPQGVVSAPVGTLYSRTDGGTGTTLYVKEAGTGNTGWVAK